MPQVTVYVRAEDMTRWQAIEKKSEFLHAALNHPGARGKERITRDPMREAFKDAPAIDPEESYKAYTGEYPQVEELPRNDSRVAKAVAQAEGVCKHGAAKGFCKFGCK